MKRYKMLSQLWSPFALKNISMYAAGACFYLFLSAIPGTILFLSLISQITFVSEILDSFFRDAFPDVLFPILSSFWKYIENAHSVAVVSLSFLTLLWSSSKGILSIMDGLNFALELPKVRNYFIRQLLSVAYFLLFCISIFLVLVSLVFADSLISHLPAPFRFLKKFFRYRGIIAFIVLTIIFTLLIRFLPTKRMPTGYCFLGAVISAISWIFLSLMFSIYVKYFSNYNRIFGGLGMILLMQIWLKSCISLFLYSCIFIKLRYDNQYHPVQIIRRVISFRD